METLVEVKPSKKTQCDQIRRHLESGMSITPLDAIHAYGSFRLGARIYDLKREGMPIKTQIVENNGKRFAKYFLPK